jgi:hypothetical protein
LLAVALVFLLAAELRVPGRFSAQVEAMVVRAAEEAPVARRVQAHDKSSVALSRWSEVVLFLDRFALVGAQQAASFAELMAPL